MRIILLVGHRAQHGKNEVCDIISSYLKEKHISCHQTYFAKLLKKQVAEKYGLDFHKMEDNEYKKWCPPWIEPIRVIENGIEKQIPRSIRQILIEEGCKTRSIWGATWAFAVYKELLMSDCEVGIVSDFRFPNEFDSAKECFDIMGINKIPPIKKILVHRPMGTFNDDGADNELPDISDYWDHIIWNDKENEDWFLNLKSNTHKTLDKIWEEKWDQF